MVLVFAGVMGVCTALGLGKTPAAARQDVIHAGHALIPECRLEPLTRVESESSFRANSDDPCRARHGRVGAGVTAIFEGE